MNINNGVKRDKSNDLQWELRKEIYTYFLAESVEMLNQYQASFHPLDRELYANNEPKYENSRPRALDRTLTRYSYDKSSIPKQVHEHHHIEL